MKDAQAISASLARKQSSLAAVPGSGVARQIRVVPLPILAPLTQTAAVTSIVMVPAVLAGVIGTPVVVVVLVNLVTGHL